MHLLGYVGQSLRHVLDCVVTGIAYETSFYELAENFARGHAVAKVDHDGLADCLLEGFGLCGEIHVRQFPMWTAASADNTRQLLAKTYHAGRRGSDRSVTGKLKAGNRALPVVGE